MSVFGGAGAALGRPKNTLPLLTSTVKMDADDPGMRCCFRCGGVCVCGWVGVGVGGQGGGQLSVCWRGAAEWRAQAGASVASYVAGTSLGAA
jgi:hypothetical protein